MQGDLSDLCYQLLLASAVVSAELAFAETEQLTAQQIAAQWCQSVGEDLAFQVVVLVLDHTCGIAIEGFVVLLEILVEVAHTNCHGARNVLVQSGQTQTTLVEEILLLRALVDLGVDKRLAETLQTRIVLSPRRAIHHKEFQRLADLRRCQSNTLSLVHRREHILDQFLQLGIVRRHIFALLAQHLSAIYYDRIDHCFLRFLLVKITFLSVPDSAYSPAR